MMRCTMCMYYYENTYYVHTIFACEHGECAPCAVCVPCDSKTYAHIYVRAAWVDRCTTMGYHTTSASSVQRPTRR